MTWKEEDDRKEKEISEILPKAEDEETEKQQVETGVGKSEDNTTSHKMGGSGMRGDEKEEEKEISETLFKAEGIWGDEKEAEREEKKAPQKESSWDDMTKTKPEGGRSIERTTPPQEKNCLLDPLGRTKRRKAVMKAGATQNEMGGDKGNTVDPRGDGQVEKQGVTQDEGKRGGSRGERAIWRKRRITKKTHQ